MQARRSPRPAGAPARRRRGALAPLSPISPSLPLPLFAAALLPDFAHGPKNSATLRDDGRAGDAQKSAAGTWDVSTRRALFAPALAAQRQVDDAEQEEGEGELHAGGDQDQRQSEHAHHRG